MELKIKLQIVLISNLEQATMDHWEQGDMEFAFEFLNKSKSKRKTQWGIYLL